MGHTAICGVKFSLTVLFSCWDGTQEVQHRERSFYWDNLSIDATRIENTELY